MRRCDINWPPNVMAFESLRAVGLAGVETARLRGVIRCLIQIGIWCFGQRGLLSGERVICGSKGLLMSSCARVRCCNVKSHMKTIHLDIDKTCFQCSSVSESWKSCSLKCVFRWCLFIAETSSSRRGAKTILIILTDHDSCTRLLIPLLSVRFLEVMVCQCWRKHSMLI